MKTLLIAGYVCALVALIFLPPAFALAAIVIGVIVLARGRIGNGIAIIVIGAVCGYYGLFFGDAIWRTLNNPRSSSSQSSSTVAPSLPAPMTQDWHVVSIDGRITESDETQTRYAWKLIIRNDSTEPAVFDGKVEFQDADGFIVETDSDWDMQVPAESDATFTGYALMSTQDAHKVTQTVAKISKK